MNLLIIFYKILADPSLARDQSQRYIVDFAKEIVGGFFQKLREQPSLSVEILFPRTLVECVEIKHNLGGDEDEIEEKRGRNVRKSRIEDLVSGDEQEEDSEDEDFE